MGTGVASRITEQRRWLRVRLPPLCSAGWWLLGARGLKHRVWGDRADVTGWGAVVLQVVQWTDNESGVVRCQQIVQVNLEG